MHGVTAGVEELPDRLLRPHGFHGVFLFPGVETTFEG